MIRRLSFLLLTVLLLAGTLRAQDSAEGTLTPPPTHPPSPKHQP